MPGCADCIDELIDNGYTAKQAVFIAQYPPLLLTIPRGQHVYLCSRHSVTRYIRKREEKTPTLGPKGPAEGVAK